MPCNVNEEEHAVQVVFPPPAARNGDNTDCSAYRVPLGWGRDGFAVFVPDEPQMTPMYEVLRTSGLSVLRGEDGENYILGFLR